MLSRSAASKMKLVQRIEEVSQLFDDIGLLNCKPVTIKLKANAVPYSVTSPRRIVFPLLSKVEVELKSMLDNHIIEKVTEPTDWCPPMVPVLKPSGKVKICLDLKKLTEAVRRQRYVLPTLKDIAPTLVKSIIFSSLDASSRFWQIPLEPQSRKLTTFISPFGRFSFLRLPYGISSASEIFQREMSELLRGLPGVEVPMDDILVHAGD